MSLPPTESVAILPPITARYTCRVREWGRRWFVDRSEDRQEHGSVQCTMISGRNGAERIEMATTAPTALASSAREERTKARPGGPFASKYRETSESWLARSQRNDCLRTRKP